MCYAQYCKINTNRKQKKILFFDSSSPHIPSPRMPKNPHQNQSLKTFVYGENLIECHRGLHSATALIIMWYWNWILLFPFTKSLWPFLPTNSSFLSFSWFSISQFFTGPSDSKKFYFISGFLYVLPPKSAQASLQPKGPLICSKRLGPLLPL